MSFKYCLNDYYSYAKEVWSEMMKNDSYFDSDKKLFCTQVAYHHWLNQDNLDELNKIIRGE